MFKIKSRLNFKNLSILIIILLALAVTFGGITRSGAANVKLNYVALGDSLAAGYGSDGTMGKGYADFLAADLKASGLLGEFDKRYAVTGFTSKDVLTALQEDKHTNLPESPDSLGINNRLAQADIITLDIGANDLLSTVKFDAKTGRVSYDPGTVLSVPAQVETNVKDVIVHIKKVSPKAQVYLMGYYNPFWALPQEPQAVLTLAVAQLNIALNTAASSTGATFVPTQEAIAADSAGYLPNTHDIHPNQEGYRVIAEEFWLAIKTKLSASGVRIS